MSLIPNAASRAMNYYTIFIKIDVIIVLDVDIACMHALFEMWKALSKRCVENVCFCSCIRVLDR